MIYKPERNPVILIHGIDSSASEMTRLSTHLTGRGWTTHSISLTPNNGDCTLQDLAAQVKHIIDRQYPEQAVDLVCFSMGGIVGRYYLQRLGGLERVQRFVTISSPHVGTFTAYFRDNHGGRQLRPDSDLLADLNRDIDSLASLKITTIWTPLDLMIVPAWSSRLSFGHEVVIPVFLHPWMLRSRRVHSAVEMALEK
jgi:triacylglycerol lipase